MSPRRPASPHPGGLDATAAGSGSTTGVPSPRGASRGPSGRAAAARAGASRGARGATGRAGGRAASTRPASRTATGASRPTAGAVSEPPAGVPRVFTVRALVLFVVLLLAFVLLFPTVRAHLVQQAENRELAQQVAEARGRTEDLRVDLDRWQDPAYVAAQARERLAFVRPGETAYRVVDPETVVPTAPAVPAAGSGPALVPDGTTSPWYQTIWESVRVAGEAEVSTSAPAPPAPGISVAPTPGAPGPAPAAPTP